MWNRWTARFSWISWKWKESFDVAISYFCRFCWSPRSFSSAPESSWETRSLLYKSPWTSSAVRRSSDKTFRFYRAKAGTLPDFLLFNFNYHLLRNDDFRQSRRKWPTAQAVCTRKVKSSVFCDNGGFEPVLQLSSFQFSSIKFTIWNSHPLSPLQ